MLPEYQEKIEIAQKSKNAIKRASAKLRKMRKGKVDDIIHPLHEEAFEEIDCLKCANCCKTTSPIFTNRDISRISKHFKIKEAAFVEQFLKVDDEEDFVLQSSPCPFLADDNRCNIYEHRPKACAAYPHTHQTNVLGIMQLTQKNATICPAVADIFEKLV